MMDEGEQEMVEIDSNRIRAGRTKSAFANVESARAESVYSSVSTRYQQRRDGMSGEEEEVSSLLTDDDRSSYVSVPIEFTSRATKSERRNEFRRTRGEGIGGSESENEGERKGEDSRRNRREKKRRTSSRSSKNWKQGYDIAKREWENENADSYAMRIFGCCAYFMESYVFGTAPGLLRALDGLCVLDFLFNVTLRSVGQVAFCNNPWSGFLIIAAFLADFENMGGACLYGLACVFVSNLTAFFLGIDRGLLRHGLFGFNAFLIGIGVSVFLESTKHDWTPDYPIMFGVFSCGVAAVFVQLAVSKIVGTFGEIPCLTLPFNIMLIMFLFDSERQFSVRSVNPLFIQPSQISIVSAPSNQTDFVGENLPEGWIKGLSEIFVINDIAASVLILVAMLIYSRIAAGLALTGSMIGLVSSVALGSNNTNVKIGLWGYNPALTMMAIGGVFAVPSFDSFVLASLASFLTQLIWAALVQFFAPWGLPVCTLPFCFATIAFMLVRPDVSSRFKYVSLAEVTTPEEHYRKHGGGSRRS